MRRQQLHSSFFSYSEGSSAQIFDMVEGTEMRSDLWSDCQTFLCEEMFEWMNIYI